MAPNIVTAVSTSTSFMLSSVATVMIFAGMQMFKQQLGSTQWLTILGGFTGAGLFVFLLTAVSNLETVIFGRNFQTKLFPEVLFCLFVAMFASGLVHRVCVTTCFIFSCISIYYINKLAQAKYAPTEPTATVTSKSKKRK